MGAKSQSALPFLSMESTSLVSMEKRPWSKNSPCCVNTSWRTPQRISGIRSHACTKPGRGAVCCLNLVQGCLRPRPGWNFMYVSQRHKKWVCKEIRGWISSSERAGFGKGLCLQAEGHSLNLLPANVRLPMRLWSWCPLTLESEHKIWVLQLTMKLLGDPFGVTRA